MSCDLFEINWKSTVLIIRNNYEEYEKIITLKAVLLFSVLSSPLFAQENVFIKEYLETLEKSKDYLILVAKAMPEDNYGFQATPESMSFAEHLMHIGWAMD